MTKEETLQYSKLITSMSLDFQLGKIDKDHYINTLKLAISKMKSDEVSDLEAIADITSRIFYYGNFKIETPSEKTLAGLLNDRGLFPTTEDHILKRKNLDNFYLKYRNYKL